MFSTRGTVKAKVRALLDDEQGSYVTDSYVDPLIQQEYEAAASELDSTLSPFADAVVEVPGLGAGVSDLSAQQAAGGLLESLMEPTRIDWKLAGLTANYYRKLSGPREMLPDLVPCQFPVAWEWRANVIYLVPTTVSLDLRVRGEFDVPVLRSDDDPLTLHKRIGYVIADRVAALVAKGRGNQQWVVQYTQDARDGMDQIMEQLVRADQRKIRRIGRMASGGRSRNRF